MLYDLTLAHLLSCSWDFFSLVFVFFSFLPASFHCEKAEANKQVITRAQVCATIQNGK